MWAVGLSVWTQLSKQFQSPDWLGGIHIVQHGGIIFKISWEPNFQVKTMGKNCVIIQITIKVKLQLITRLG